MWTAFPPSNYYGPSAPPRRHRPTTCLPVPALAVRQEGRHRSGSHVHLVPINGIGAQLFPCNLATSTPQAFLVASPPAHETGFGVAARRNLHPACVAARPTSTRLEPVASLRGFNHWFTCVTPSVSLAGPEPSGSTDPSRRCQGCFPPSPALPGSGCPQLHRPAATERRRVLSSRPVQSASWRTRARSNKTERLRPPRQANDGLRAP